MGSGPERGQSPVENWGNLSIHTYVCTSVHPSPPCPPVHNYNTAPHHFRRVCTLASRLTVPTPSCRLLSGSTKSAPMKVLRAETICGCQDSSFIGFAKVRALGMWKRLILIPLPPLPLPLSLPLLLPLPFCSENTSSNPILQIGSGQSLPHP